MGLADLTRVTDLFVEGREAVLRDGEDPVLLWVNKLNSFEMEEARRDGAAARSRVVLAMKEIGSPEFENFEAMLVEMTDAKIVEALLSEKYNDHFVSAVEATRRDPDWQERLDASERRTPEMADEERAVVEKIDAEYSDEITRRIEVLQDDERKDLQSRYGSEELRQRYRETWVEARGIQAFGREFQKTQLYYALRVCGAKAKSQTGAWDHSGCEGHRQRALADREEVTELPGGLLDRLMAVVREVTMDRRDARFTDALASSSASSAQPSEEAASTPSTPEVMSPALATTSS